MMPGLVVIPHNLIISLIIKFLFAFHLNSRISGRYGARVDFNTENSLIVRILGVAWLTSQASLHDHPELLAFLLVDSDM